MRGAEVHGPRARCHRLRPRFAKLVRDILTVPSAHKDDVLLALLTTNYSGNASVVEEFKEYLESRGIPREFDSYA